jgi:hypothetical protein
MAGAAAFVSYSRVDLAFVRHLVQDLKVAGVSVWLDKVDIRPGKEWDRAIEEALLGSPRMLLVLSPTSASSNNVLDEITLALRTHKTIIPILYQDCVMPLRVCRLQYIDFRTDYAESLQELIEQLKRQETTANIPVMRAVVARANAAGTERKEEIPFSRVTIEPAPFAVRSQDESASSTARLQPPKPAIVFPMTLPRLIAAQLSKARRALFRGHP